MKNLLLTTVLMLAVIFSSNATNDVNSPAKKVSISGAGATFPLPFYNLAFKTYQDKTGNSITYGGIGSGGGIRSLKDKIVDFGGSDAYLSDKEMSEMPATVVHIPTCMGAVVLAYNLPGVDNLKLTGDIIADIYLGKITKWNDSRIAAINLGVNLPDKAMSPVYRSDGSGTTFVFSDYMTKVSPEWAEKIGTGKSLKWPVGMAAKGNPGVAGVISQTEGSIGYVGSEYAFAMKIQFAQMRNAAGNFITPNTESISAAAKGDMPADTRTMITNSAAPDAYPISCFSWVMLYRDQSYSGRTREQAEQTLAVLRWLVGPEAQNLAAREHYAPLPTAVAARAVELLDSVTYGGKPLK